MDDIDDFLDGISEPFPDPDDSSAEDTEADAPQESLITDEQYRTLVGYATELLRKSDSIGSEEEAEVARVALNMLPADLEDRDEHANDLALEAMSDAAAATGRKEEMDSPDW